MLETLLHLSRRLYAEQPARRWKFLARSLLYGRSNRDWLGYLAQRPWTLRMVLRRPELAERLQRPYQCRRFDRWARLGALREHYDACEQIGWQVLCRRLARGPVVLARVQGAHEQDCHVELRYDTRFAKEGEWACNLSDGTRRCYTMVLGLRRHAQGRALYVGCVQGPDGPDGREQVRRLTKAFHGQRPRDLLLEVVRELAACAGCAHIEMVSDGQHIYRSWRRRRRFAFSYDRWACELGAVRNARNCWALPLRGALRALEELDSRKRAAARRRRALLEALREQVRQACGAAAPPP